METWRRGLFSILQASRPIKRKTESRRGTSGCAVCAKSVLRLFEVQGPGEVTLPFPAINDDIILRRHYEG